MRIHSTTEPTFPLIQTLGNAHKLGCHHICTAKGGAGTAAASVGFGGEIKIWKKDSPQSEQAGWSLNFEIPVSKSSGNNGDVWAVALSADENYLAATTSDGRIHVWDLGAREKIQSYETGASSGGGGVNGDSGGGGGSFAMAVDLSRDGKFTASGHENGSVYVFNNDAGRMVYSLSGELPMSFFTQYVGISAN